MQSCSHEDSHHHPTIKQSFLRPCRHSMQRKGSLPSPMLCSTAGSTAETVGCQEPSGWWGRREGWDEGSAQARMGARREALTSMHPTSLRRTRLVGSRSSCGPVPKRTCVWLKDLFSRFSFFHAQLGWLQESDSQLGSVICLQLFLNLPLPPRP